MLLLLIGLREASIAREVVRLVSTLLLLLV
jgi:hypothetical protein